MIQLIGFAAGIFTTFAAVPQLIKSFKTKETKDISLATYMALLIGMTLWVIYGFFIKDMPVFIWNIIALFIVLGVILLKLKHG